MIDLIIALDSTQYISTQLFCLENTTKLVLIRLTVSMKNNSHDKVTISYEIISSPMEEAETLGEKPFKYVNKYT